MCQIKLSSNLNYLQINYDKVFLLCVKNSLAQNLGLLNHRKLDCGEGLVFRDKRIFHTFGMNFPIAIYAFNKKKDLIALPIIVKPNQVFICPLNSRYVVEAHSKHGSIKLENKFNSSFKILSHNTSKIIYLLFKILPVFLIILFGFFTFKNVFAEQNINLVIGKSRTIHLENAPQTIQIDDPEIIELERIGITNSIKITPKQMGQTRLTFQYPEELTEIIAVNVSANPEFDSLLSQDSSEEKKSPEFENSLRMIKKLKFLDHTVMAGKIFLFGKITTIDQFKSISKIVESFPNYFFSAYEIDSKILDFVIDSLNSDIQLIGNHNLKIIRRGDQTLLKGVNSSKEEKNKIWTYLAAILPNIVDASESMFGESTLVQVNLTFFEIGKRYKKDIGFQFSNPSQLTFYSENFKEPFFQIAPFSVFFRALSTRNYVKEIAKPVIMTRSGEKASFLAGGEVPIPAVTVNATSTNTSVTYKSVGIVFDVTPKAIDDGTIWLKLNVEYSQIDESLSFQNSPGFNTRKISTNVVLKEGSAAIISGLIKNTDLKKSEYTPILSKIPILGELFKNRESNKHSTELIIAVSALLKKDL